MLHLDMHPFGAEGKLKIYTAVVPNLALWRKRTLCNALLALISHGIL